MTGIGVLEVELGRELASAEGLDGKEGLDGPGGAEGVADGGLGRADAGGGEGGAEKGGVGFGFGAVVDGGRGAVSVEVADLGGRDFGLGGGGAHDFDERGSFGLGLGEVEEVGGVGVAGEVAERDGAAALGVRGRFDDDEGGGFAEEEAVAVEVEGAAAVGAGGLEAVEADEDEFGERLEAAGEDAFGGADGDEVGGVADGVGTAGAGIGVNGGVAGEAERQLDVEDLLVGEITGGAADHVGAFAGEDAAEKFFAEGHATRGGGDGEGEVAHGAAAGVVEQAGAGEGFAGGGNGEAGGAGEAAECFSVTRKFGEGRESGGGGVVAAANFRVEEVEGGLGIVSGDECGPGSGEVFPEWRDGAEAGNDDAASHGFRETANRKRFCDVRRRRPERATARL